MLRMEREVTTKENVMSREPQTTCHPETKSYFDFDYNYGSLVLAA